MAAVDLRDLLTQILPFPPGELPGREVACPSDLHDPQLAEDVFHAILEGALLQGGAPGAATAFAALAAEAITGRAVEGPIAAPVQEAFDLSLDPARVTTVRCHLMDDEETVLDDQDISHALEKAWQAAKRMRQRL